MGFPRTQVSESRWDTVWTRELGTSRHEPPRIAVARVWAVASSAAGKTWLYVSMVMATLACPRRSLITLTSCQPAALARLVMSNVGSCGVGARRRRRNA